MSVLKLLLREPLVHFLLLGGGLFVLYFMLNGDAPAPERVVVRAATLERLTSDFERVAGRRPNPSELQTMVDDWVDEEILYREGRAAGLGEGDQVVRGRIVQKMRFLLEAMASEVPTESELSKWLAEHPERYRSEARVTLRQLYFDPKKRGQSLEEALQKGLLRLEQDASDGEGIGDAISLPARVRHASSSEIVRVFGTGFQRAIDGAPVGKWFGPVDSGFGRHLVIVDERSEGRIPSLDEVRERVVRDVSEAQAAQAHQKSLEVLRSRYAVTVETRDELPEKKHAMTAKPSAESQGP